MSRKIMAAILAHERVNPLLSDEHFPVDGTLIKAWASMKSLQPKADEAPPDDGDNDGSGGSSGTATDTLPEQDQPESTLMPRTARKDRNEETDVRGEKRSSVTHASKADPDARLCKKSPGAGAMLCFMGHTLMENRNGLIVQANLTQADGHAERRAALEMIERHSPARPVA